MILRTFSAQTLESKSEADTCPWRIVYADHLPVQEWRVYFCESRGMMNDMARKMADDDLKNPAIEVNIFILQRWNKDEERWDDDDEEGNDLSFLCFHDGGED